MLISKHMAALIGGLLFAAILGFIPKGCAHQPQPAKQALAIAQPLPLPTNPDPWAGMSDQERLHGDAEIPREKEAAVIHAKALLSLTKAAE